MTNKNKGKRRRSKSQIRLKIDSLQKIELSFDLKLAEGGSEKPPTFDMVAYTGDQIRQSRFDDPVVVDLAGMKITKKSRPVFKDHYAGDIVGHTTSISNDLKTLTAKGVMSGVESAAQEVLSTAKNNFPWQASIGASVQKVEFIKEDEKVYVNGRKFTGPIVVARETRLSEISFVALGADDATTATIAASSENQAVESEKPSVQLTGETQVNFSHEETNPMSVEDVTKQLNEIKAARTELDDAMAEIKAQKHDLQLVAAAGDNEDILAKAREEKWSVEKVKSEVELKAAKAELESIKASAPEGGFNIHVTSSKPKNEVQALSAALMLSLGYSEDDINDPCHDLDKNQRKAMGNPKSIEAENIDFAVKNFKGFGLSNVALYAARQNGYHGHNVRDDEAIQASFNWINSPTVYKNVLDRILIRNYVWEDLTWNRVVATRSVRDFKAYQSFRVYGMGHWEKLSPQGEMRQGKLEEQAGFTNQIDTYGQVNVISRKQLIDDDLGILDDMGGSMARWGSLVPERMLVNMLNGGTYRDGSDYFSAGNGNLQTGTSFGHAGLKTVYEAFIHQSSPQTLPSQNKGAEPKIKTTPRMIYAPYEMEIDMEDFFGTKDFEVTRTAKSSQTGATVKKNTFYNRFQRVYSPYLADASWGGGASSTWYMFGDVNTGVPAIEFAFLNGVQRPTIETGNNVAHDRLGIYIRGYYDLGGNFGELNAAQKVTA